MKTVLISSNGDVPLGLREVVARGSTTLLERRPRDLAGSPLPDVDRIVFWSDGPDPAMQSLAERYARAEAAERREILVYVSAEGPGASAQPPLSANELFVWPRDEDRLQMAFLTGG